MGATVSVVVMALVLVSITIAGALSGAETEPLAFKEYILGVTRLSEMKQIDPRVKCSQWEGAIAEDQCYSTVETIADEDAKEATFFFYAEKLEKIIITMDHAKFEKVVSVLKDKYGRPTAAKMVLIQNRMGATIKGKQYTWKRINAEITAQEYDEMLHESSVSYRTSRAIEEDQKRHKKQTKKGSGDL
ncbi:MAG TPA: hypothetical protein VEI04_00635 [Syntrophobacteria bacterium]|nr:hypothetical protein [Syntrophobacteria bacterium]